jgi:hypothetical protein
MTQPFTMPIQAFSKVHPAATVTFVPTDEDCEWAKKNHDQTLQRLKERGGMSWCEMAAILHHRRHHKMDWDVARLSVMNEIARRSIAHGAE